MAPEQAPGVLHLEIALQRRLEKIAEERGHDDDDAENDRLPDAQKLVPLVVEHDERDEDARGRAAQEPLPRLLRGQARRQAVAPDEAAREIGERVGGEHGQDDGERDQAPLGVHLAQE